jgi:hypothetical protein
MILAAHGLFLGLIGLEMNKLYRSSSPGVFGALSVIMLHKALFYVVGPAAVIGTICAFYDVCVIHQFHSLFIDYPGIYL